MNSHTGRSLTVSWSAPAEGNVTGYSVTLVAGDTSKTQTLGKDTTSTTFTGLTPGTEYNIAVVSVSGDQTSTEEKGIFYTG